MNKTLRIALATLLASASFSTACAQNAATQLVTKNDSVSYAAGYMISEEVKNYVLPRMKAQYSSDTDSINEQLFYRGFEASAKGDTTVYDIKTAAKAFETAAKALAEKKAAAAKAENAAFLAENAKKKGVVTLPSGLQYRVITKGKGDKPTLEDKVQVVYEGRTIDGKVFDATAKHGGKDYDEFALKGLIKGWQEAMTMMPVGSKWELYIPYNLAYGERGNRDIPPYATLIFTLELKGIASVPAAAKSNPKVVRSQTAPVGKK